MGDVRSKVQPTKYNSLPHRYKHSTPHTRLTLQPSLSQTRVEPLEFKRRLETIMSWVTEFSDSQKTLLVSALFPQLGSSQLHFISSQLPEHSPGLHHLCQTGCSDPLSLLPPHLSLSVLSMLSPRDLARVSRVCSTWRDLANTSSLWQTLCRREEFVLSPAGCEAQLERWRGRMMEVDWRQVFVERYKLRRAWMGGQCHVRTFEGHTGGISCVQFDGGRIVSGSHDKTIKVWNVKTNSPWSVITLAGHSGEVRCLHLGK